MFGGNIHIEHRSRVVDLRPFCKDDIRILADNFSSLKIHLYTMGRFGYPYENELDWYERNRVAKDNVHWAIVPQGQKDPIGVTGLNEIDPINLGCTSGIIIWDQTWWGKGVASACHLARTLFAADWLNRYYICSTVRTENQASRKALERVGYTIWGTEVIDDWKDGRWLDTYHLKWLHPERINWMFKNGAPEQYLAGIKRAQEALDMARSVVTFP